MRSLNLTPEEEARLTVTLGQVFFEKLSSLRSKTQDDTATSTDRIHLEFAEEIFALAKNRFSVNQNEEQALTSGTDIWVERSSGHYPHIRLHGGARDEDIPSDSPSPV